MGKAKIGVLIIDDQPLVREGLRKVLAKEEDIKILAEAGDGQGAINMARSWQPDIVLMDVNMPGTNGIEATRVIKREFPEMKVIALTVHEEEEHVLELERAGFAGYVLKDLAETKLVATIKTVDAG